MMKNILHKLCFVLCLLMITGMAAQKTKKVFLDENDSVITRRVFKKKYKKANAKMLDLLIVDTDSLKVWKLFWREHQGVLNAVALEQLKKYLQKLSGKEIPEANYVVVNYYPGIDRCNKSDYTSFRLEMLEGYETAVDILGTTSQFYIHERDADSPFETEKNRSLKDQTNLFKHVFFPYPFPCDSYVVMHPDGRYIKYYGEHHLQTVLDILQADWDQDFFWE
ncbi:hypothetical protein [Ascidiimonas sp. W6]|uniref:hypothetical protein n=1 Tax=Ascidiimonas meishanensis TaxID=3128903 RepID=UPI0030EC610B